LGEKYRRSRVLSIPTPRPAGRHRHRPERISVRNFKCRSVTKTESAAAPLRTKYVSLAQRNITHARGRESSIFIYPKRARVRNVVSLQYVVRVTCRYVRAARTTATRTIGHTAAAVRSTGFFSLRVTLRDTRDAATEHNESERRSADRVMYFSYASVVKNSSFLFFLRVGRPTAYDARRTSNAKYRLSEKYQTEYIPCGPHKTNN